jgi:hypothetical protein
MRHNQRSFAGGELAPQLFGRADLVKYQTGLATCKNFAITPQGSAENRPGFAYVNRCKGDVAVLIPFTFSSEQTFTLEFGDQYIRFHTQGATLLEGAFYITGITNAAQGVVSVPGHGLANGRAVYLSGIAGMTDLNNRYFTVTDATANTFKLLDELGNYVDTSGMSAWAGGGTSEAVYELTTIFTEPYLYDLHYVQSADVLTIVHPFYPPYELRRLGATNWTLTVINFLPTIGTPAAPAVAAASASGTTGDTPIDHEYVTTAIAAGTLEESLPSTSATISNDLTMEGHYNTVQTAPVDGAIRYNVYKKKSGIYGFVGQTDGSEFKDDNIDPDLSTTPPLATNPFSSGAISSVTVTAGGTGYNAALVTGGGVVNAISIIDGGSGYGSAPTVSISDIPGGQGSGATATATLTSGSVTSISITNGGTLYTSPQVSIAAFGPGGASAVASASALTMDPPLALSITDPSGTGAVIEPVVQGGVVVGVRVVDPGSGYTAPSVTVDEDGGGSGATFSVSITGGIGVYPAAVSYFEQRRVFAGSDLLPQTLWFTRAGTEKNMSYSIPTRDDDAITMRVVAREGNRVRHLVPLGDLLALTSGGVWRIGPASADVFTPSNNSARSQGYIGASNVQPVVSGQSVLYAPERGSHIREVTFRWETQSYQADDICVLAPHLFDYQSVLQMTYSRAPVQTLWVARGDGVMLGMTHVPEHEVKAWHRHETDGVIESVCSVAEGEEDGVYIVVAREIGGQTHRFIERLHSRQFDALEDAFFVDSGKTYRGAPATEISGLWHLEGMEVSILADGGVEPRQTVTNGRITLESAASVVHVGLPYECDLETLPLAMEMAGLGQGAPKNVSQVHLRVLRSSSIKAGPTFDKLRAYRQRSVADEVGTPPPLVTDVVQVDVDPLWQQNGTVCVRQSDPLPLTVLSMSLEAGIGG